MSASFTTLLVSMVLLRSTQSSWAHCVFTTENDQDCIAQYICSGEIEDLNREVVHWGCRRQIQPRYYFSDSGFTLPSYSVKVALKDLYGYTDFSKLQRLATHIQTVSVKNGKLTSIPTELLYFENLSVLDLSNNNITSIRLQSILVLERLQVFNASFNNISNFEVDKHVGLSSRQVVSSIDLSYNAIEALPDSYLSKFRTLLHLNLSYNMIESFSILSFEGVADLETLYLSHNKLRNLDMSLARFYNLKELILNNNNLTTIKENNFKVMSKLVTLELSNNKINSIDELSFQNMINLQNVKLSNNNIEIIPKSMFLDNNNLRVLDLSNNHISMIESYPFKGKYITELNLRNNYIASLPDKNFFVGVSTEKLDLSCNGITKLGPDLFSELHLQLKSINLSSNAIENIDEHTFRSLSFLTHLDLSKNKLQHFDFDNTDLNNLLFFSAESNFIEKITRDTFKNLRTLKEIHLSNNSITDLGTLPFTDLNHLETLDLSKNHLSSVITPDIFRGLSLTMALNLTYSKINTLQGGAFDGMASLTYLNVSYSELEVLDYNAFNNTGIIIFLDLSHNRLKQFLVNNTEIKLLLELYLNDNKITSVTNETFMGLSKLQILNLDNNEIFRIDNGAFRSLYGMSSLMLSSNIDMVFDSSMLLNLSSLTEVSVRDVWKPFNFGNIRNSSVISLDLSSCNITDINAMKLFNMRKLERVSLKSNKIRSVDKHSFQNLSALIVLDLSNNLISDIQPGSFASSTEIYQLNLSNNNLSSLPFGVFDGLEKLQFLNLSFNTLHSFKGNIFHNSHRIEVISLDNNMLESLDFHEINSAHIPKVTIGGNLIPCDILVASKKENLSGVIVTTEIKQYHTENVDGISCRGLKLETAVNQGNEVGASAPAKMTSNKEVDNAGIPYSKVIINKLGDLTAAVYFETSCLVIILGLLLMSILVRYFKLRNKLTRSYSLDSRRHLTGSVMDVVEL